MRIRTIIFIGFILIAALIGITGYYASEKSMEALQETIVENAEQLAIDKIDYIDRRIQRRMENIEIFITRPLIIQQITESNTEFEKMANVQEYINQKDNEWTAVKKQETTPFMQELRTNELAKHVQTIYSFMEKQYSYPLFAEIFITNKYGAVIAQSGKTTDYRQDDEEWWQTAKNHKIYTGDAEYDESTSIYSIPIAIRIDDEQGNFIGIIKTVLDLRETVKIVQGEKSATETTPKNFILADSRGRVIYATSPFQIFEPITKKIPTYYMQAAEKKQFFIEKENQGTEELYVEAQSKGYKEYTGHNWVLLIEYNTKEAFTPAIQLRNTILGISGAIFLLAILSGIYVSNKIAKPIKKLTENINEITKGKLDIQPEKSKIQEIHALTESFNRVLASLKLAVLKTGLKKEEIGLGEAIKAKEEAEAKYKTIYDTSKDAIMTLSRKQFLEGNPATLRIFGLNNIEELRKAHPSDLSPPKQPNGNKSFPEAMKHIETAFKKGTDHFYWIHKRKDGTPFDADVLLSRINEELLQATVRDITTEKKGEEQYQYFLEQSTDAVLIADPQTQKFAESNKAAETLFGYTKNEFKTLHVYEIHPKSELKKVKEVFQKMERGDKTLLKTTIITKNKNKIPVEIIGASIKFHGQKMMQGLFKVIKKKE